FDFSAALPEDDRFWQVYASGTYQNVPAIGTRLYRGTPGRYLYTSELPRLEPGSYRLVVTAADVCGNTGSLALPFTVVEPTGPPGYRVVFSGVYRTAAQAAAAAFAASARYPGAYPRLIVPPAEPLRRRVAHRHVRARVGGRYAVVAASVPATDGYLAARDEASR